jgi:hypothetical protein
MMPEYSKENFFGAGGACRVVVVVSITGLNPEEKERASKAENNMINAPGKGGRRVILLYELCAHDLLWVRHAAG